MAGAPVREAHGGLSRPGLPATLLILAIALGLLLLAGGAHLQLLEARRLVESGASTQGKVTEVLGGGKSGGSHRYSYEYRVGSERFVQARRNITYDARYAHKAGDPLQVWYDRARPETSTTRAEVDELESWANRAFFPAAALALAAWAVARLRRRRAQRR